MTDSNSADKAETGEKHQTEHESPDAKRPKTEKQTTIEESLGKDNEVNASNEKEQDSETKKGEKEEQDSVSKDEQTSKPQPDEQNEDGAVKPGEEPEVPSSILEKGIIYFFIRGRVGIDSPSSVNDIARSYFLLRPIAHDAKLGEGTIGDAGNTRLLALPKKVLPVSGKDRFMVFVEKSSATFQEIKDDFLASSDYETKTAGTRHSPAATPVGEGVYAMTTTGRESHLVYLMTLPEEMGKVQGELGIKEKGSFIISTKNPQYPGPANAQLPEGPKFPKEIIDDFRSLRWLPSKPEHFDYPNAQVLLVGESSGIEKAVEPQKEDKDGEEKKEDPEVALEHLEEEDLKRMKDLPGDQSASIFADLQARAKDYPKLQTTF